jgi:hypothetical protein
MVARSVFDPEDVMTSSRKPSSTSSKASTPGTSAGPSSRGCGSSAETG